jgi:hypothetical protein
MWTVRGGIEESERQFWGMEQQKRDKVEAVWWESLHPLSITKQLSAHPRVANAQELILHVSWG